MPTLHVHDLRIAYHRWSPAEGIVSAPARAPVVCLPSTGLSGLQWRRLAKQLAGLGHEVFAVDLLGYGESDDWPSQIGVRGERSETTGGERSSPSQLAKAGPGPFRTSYDVDVAQAVLDLCDRPAHLVAHSYGGRVGLQLGLRQPDRLRSLALFEPTCFGVLRSTQDAASITELLDYDHDGRFLADDFGGTPAWVERFVDYWSGPGTFAEFDEIERERWLRSSRKMFEEVRETALDDIPHTAYVEALGALPCLVMSGAGSTIAGRRCSATLAEVMPHGRHVELDDVGHMAPVLASREVAELVVAHIDAVERG